MKRAGEYIIKSSVRTNLMPSNIIYTPVNAQSIGINQGVNLSNRRLTTGWCLFTCVNVILNNFFNFKRGALSDPDNLWMMINIILNHKPDSLKLSDRSPFAQKIINFILRSDVELTRKNYYDQKSLIDIVSHKDFQDTPPDVRRYIVTQKVVDEINKVIGYACYTQFSPFEINAIFGIKIRVKPIIELTWFDDFKNFLSTSKRKLILKFIDPEAGEDHCLVVDKVESNGITLWNPTPGATPAFHDWQELYEEWRESGRMKYNNKKILSLIYEI